MIDSGFKYGNKAYQIFKELNFTRGLAGTSNLIGQVYDYRGSKDSAIFYFTEALNYYKILKDISREAGILNNIGVVHKSHGNIPKALEYLFASLKIKEKLRDTVAIANSYLNLGSLYSEADDKAKALQYYLMALELRKKLGDPSDICNSYAALGSYYQGVEDFEKALPYLNDALKMSEQLGDEEAIAIGCYNLANVYYRQNKTEQAEKLYLRAFELSKKNNNDEGIATCLMTLGEINLKNNNTAKGLQMLEDAYAAATRIDTKELIGSSANKLSIAYAKTGNYEKAYKYNLIWVNIKDSLFSQENVRKLTSEGLKYEYEKEKILQQKEEEKKEAIRHAESFKKDLTIAASILFLITISIFSFIVFKRLQENKKQKSIIEQQRNEMIDSINYARRIQFALLAHAELLKENLGEHFVFFKPKDIVSGDFYWATLKDDYFYLAICDSTGHGVPGAFMSLLNISFLNEAINEKNITDPNLVLNHVRLRLIENTDGGKDGMDAVLIKIPVKSNAREIHYAAANNSPVLIRNGELIELPKDKMPVGRGERMNDFKLQSIQFQKGDHLYFYTDGFADQFGGPNGKKFKRGELGKLLLSNINKPLHEQEKSIAAAFEKWRGNLEQVDDVCVIGFRL